jgi:hypothetical protein
MSFNNRDKHCKDLDLHKKTLGDEDGKDDNVAALEVHQHGGDSTPNPTNQQQECISMGETKTCEAPFKGLKNSTYVPSPRGPANVQHA